MYGGELGYRMNREEGSFIREISHGLEIAHWEYLDTGFIQTQMIQGDFFSIRSREGDFARIDIRAQKEGLLPGEQPLDRLDIFIPPGEYSFERWGTFIRSASHRKWSFEFRIDDGGYFNGDLFHVRPEIEWTPNEHLSFSLQYDYNDYDFPGNQSAITRQITFENEISFNAKWSLVTLAQYDNISDNIGINSRLRLNLLTLLNERNRLMRSQDPNHVAR
jgi:hypothetical protein